MPNKVAHKEAEVEKPSPVHFELVGRTEKEKKGRTRHYYHHIRYTVLENLSEEKQVKIDEIIEEVALHYGGKLIFFNGDKIEMYNGSHVEYQIGKLNGEPLENAVAEKVVQKIQKTVNQFLSEVHKKSNVINFEDAAKRIRRQIYNTAKEESGPEEPTQKVSVG